MKMKKAAVWALIAIIGMRTMSFTSYAAEQAVNAAVPASVESGAQILSTDQIITKYRVNTTTGKTQYRRWNATKGYWVDPYWINL